MKLLDDPRQTRPDFVFLSQSAMARRQTDRWVRLALIAEALRRHGRGKAKRLIQVKRQIHRFLAELLWAIGEERRHDWGDELWQHLLTSDPRFWKKIYNEGARQRQLIDDPVPKSVTRSLCRIDLSALAEALERMPVRAVGGGLRISQRIAEARRALSKAENELWKRLLAQSRWQSPLLVMDEAHHLKNPHTSLAQQLQSPESEKSMRTGDGAMAHTFDRMLFVTATPFQLGHHELVRVLERFGDVRWNDAELGEKEKFLRDMGDLRAHLDDSQRGAIAFQRAWSRLTPEDYPADAGSWWRDMASPPKGSLRIRQKEVIEAFHTAKRTREVAERALQPWIVRHNKGKYWDNTEITRRIRFDGAAIAELSNTVGLPVAPNQLLPFFLAARSAVSPTSDVLGEALSSSYEAFRYTRERRQLDLDVSDLEQEQTLADVTSELAHARWYLTEFDKALLGSQGSSHPKVMATVRRVVDLWERGEKVLVFAFYRRTCRALRIHISSEIRRRLEASVREKLQADFLVGQTIDEMLASVHKRFFDDLKTRGRRALDQALSKILSKHDLASRSALTEQQLDELLAIMRRFLRAPTTLARCFPLQEMNSISPEHAVERALDHVDESRTSWREKFHSFLDFLADRCTTDEQRLYIEAASRTQTGGIRVEDPEIGKEEARIAVANVQIAMGTTKRDARQRLMRAFNTPFFPDILVCSEVMGEGVDLQRFCRHVIHHDLSWNPSTIEQRTGRIDRLGCKAEGRYPIVVYLPYIQGTADERQHNVMCHREQWFRVVMGQDEVAKLITGETESLVPLPSALVEQLSFNLDSQHPGASAAN